MLLIATCNKDTNTCKLKIATCNLNYQNNEPDKLTDAILKQECDFYSCLEWTSKNLNKDKIRNAGYKFILDYPKTGTHGICMFVKSDIHANAQTTNPPKDGPCAIPIGIARIEFHNKSISIFGIHAPPPVPSCKNTTESSLSAIADWFKSGKIIKDIGVSKVNDDVILLGDFNVIAKNNGIHAILTAGFVDSHKKRCLFSPAATWSPKPWIPALLRIDYIFTPETMEILSVKNFRLPGSDHLGILTEIIDY